MSPRYDPTDDPDGELVRSCDELIYRDICWRALNQESPEDERIAAIVAECHRLLVEIEGAEAKALRVIVAKARVMAENTDDVLPRSLALDVIAFARKVGVP